MKMIQHILFLFLALLIISCQQNKTETPDSITVYDLETYLKVSEKKSSIKIHVVDTACINQRERALSDVKEGKLYYFHSNTTPEWREMAELLSLYNVELKDYLASCLRFDPPFNEYCYEEVMWAETEKRLGQPTIDSLWRVAERMFVMKYPDSVYMKDGEDVRKKYLKL